MHVHVLSGVFSSLMTTSSGVKSGTVGESIMQNWSTIRQTLLTSPLAHPRFSLSLQKPAAKYFFLSPPVQEHRAALTITVFHMWVILCVSLRSSSKAAVKRKRWRPWEPGWESADICYDLNVHDKRQTSDLDVNSALFDLIDFIFVFLFSSFRLRDRSAANGEEYRTGSWPRGASTEHTFVQHNCRNTHINTHKHTHNNPILSKLCTFFFSLF